MKSKAVITIISVTVVLIAIAMVALIVFMPQSKALLESNNTEYENISKYHYTAILDKDRTPNKEAYNVTESIVKEGIIEKKYVSGNSNPFTPGTELTIYNEPGHINSNTNQLNNGTKIITGTQNK